MVSRTLQVPPESAGQRLDVWLAQQESTLSRSAWKKKIQAGEVCSGGKILSPHHEVRANESIVLRFPKPKTLSTEDSSKNTLNILFENKAYAILNKPAGLTVHKGAGVQAATLADALLTHFGNKQLSTEGGLDRPGLVHRLDKDTSGLMVIAKTNAAHRNLAEQFASRTVQKTYLALVEGHLFPDQGSIEAPLKRDPHHRKKMTTQSGPGSRYALSHYEVKTRFSHPIKSTLIAVRIATGRTHQIRAHFEAIGHPILGDKTYGKEAQLKGESIGLNRQFLHAHELRFKDPDTKKEVHYQVELPEDLALALEKLGE